MKGLLEASRLLQQKVTRLEGKVMVLEDANKLLDERVRQLEDPTGEQESYEAYRRLKNETDMGR